MVVATTSDRRYCTLKLDREHELTLQACQSGLSDSPILSRCLLDATDRVVVTASMSGQVLVYNHRTETKVDERHDHRKYVVQVAAWTQREAPYSYWVATAGWDGRVFLYLTSRRQNYALGDPIASIAIATDPQSILFVEHPDETKPFLLVTRRDSTYLYYYGLPEIQHVLNIHQERLPVQIQLRGKQNLAPHSNAWIAFSPTYVALCPTDASLFAVATSDIPHM